MIGQAAFSDSLYKILHSRLGDQSQRMIRYGYGDGKIRRRGNVHAAASDVARPRYTPRAGCRPTSSSWQL